MQTFTTLNLTDEDYQLIEANQLGTSLNVYRLNLGSLRFHRIVGTIIFFMGAISLILILGLYITRRSADSSMDLVTPLMGSLYALLQGGIFYRITTRQALSCRIIVCEHGLLQIRKIIRKNRVDVVYWQDIPPIKKTFGSGNYSFYYIKEGKSTQFILDRSYQDFDELIELIRQYTEKISS